MPSLDIYRRLNQSFGNTIGQVHKNTSDVVMESTWWNDPQSKVCYIYDYFHDDQPELNQGMTYENTTKTRIDAKFIITKYGSLSSDQVEYHLMFRPSQPVNFSPADELYYYETDYAKRYSAEFPIGMMVDVPDDRGVYRKYLICAMDIANQFVKYSILPMNYRLAWIEVKDNKRIKRRMWCCLRDQKSYTSGVWLDRYITSLDDVNQLWLPMNSISEKISYTSEDSDGNQRLIISALVEKPSVWKVSRISNASPLGLLKLTYKQSPFNPHTDYVNFETGEMYADYYTNDISPIIEDVVSPTVTAEITAANNTIKNGGSYKLLTVNFYDDAHQDITSSYLTKINSTDWICEIQGVDETANVTWLPQPESNKMKVKIPKNLKWLGKIMKVSCSVGNITADIQFEIN